VRLYAVQVNNFFCLVEKLCWLAGVKNTKHFHSKKMYGNIKLSFLAVYREKLNVSYRRFVEICEENNIAHMLGLKRIPHFSTLQKFVQRTPKQLFEVMVRACSKLLRVRNCVAAIDGTGFSNTNPSHYYEKRVDGVTHPNYTKTVFISDIKTKLVLNVRTCSDHSNEITAFRPMVTELVGSLRTVLADKGYDSLENREFCWLNGLSVHIPFRKHASKLDKYGKQHYSAKRRRAMQKFNLKTYQKRAIAESVNSAIKQTLGGFVRAKNAVNQQKQATIKAIAYNIEHIGRTIKITLTLAL